MASLFIYFNRDNSLAPPIPVLHPESDSPAEPETKRLVYIEIFRRDLPPPHQNALNIPLLQLQQVLAHADQAELLSQCRGEAVIALIHISTRQLDHLLLLVPLQLIHHPPDNLRQHALMSHFALIS